VDALIAEDNVIERWVGGASAATVRRPKTFIIGLGGSGTRIATYIAAGAGSDPSVACLGIDVMGEPPAVIARDDEGVSARMLELKREYVPIGRDLDPPHLSAVLRQRPGKDVFRWLLAKQPGGRFIKSVEIGTEGERIYGYLALLWSQREVAETLRQVLKRLNDVRLVDGVGNTVDAPINVVCVCSTCGGAGSSIALAVCGLVKDMMDRLGIGVHRSLFTYVAVAADAFEETTQQLANSYESLTDLAVAQREGLTLCPRL
jgi:hypothetical protein